MKNIIRIGSDCTKLSIILWFQDTESSHYLQIDPLYITIGPPSLRRYMQCISTWCSWSVLWNYLRQTNSYLLKIETGLPVAHGYKIKLEQIRLGNSTKLFNYVYRVLAFLVVDEGTKIRCMLSPDSFDRANATKFAYRISWDSHIHN